MNDEGFLVDTEIDEGFNVDPNSTIYKVYAKKDEHGSIVDVWSTGNQALGDSKTESQILEDGYDLVDEGIDGNIFGYAQINYAEKFYGKPLFDENGIPNFRDDFIEWTEEEKKEKYPIPEPQPSKLEKLKAEQEVTAQALQELMMMVLGGEING